MVQRLFLLLLTEPITSPLLTYNITTGTFLPSLYTRPRSLASPDTADLSQISMYSAVESNRPRPTVQHHLGEPAIHDMTSDHIQKPAFRARLKSEHQTMLWVPVMQSSKLVLRRLAEESL